MMLHHNELVNIEEDTILAGNRTMIRRFTLSNRANKLSLGILSAGGSLCSWKIDQGLQEMVLPSDCKPRDTESYPPSSDWQSHVLGPDSLLLTTTASQSLTYQLTTNNELIVTGRLRHLQAMAPFYVNLNSVDSLLDGHLLRVSSSRSTAFSVSGDVKFDVLEENGAALRTPFLEDGSPVTGLIQDTIYSIPVSSPSSSSPTAPSPDAQPGSQVASSVPTDESIIAELSFLGEDGVSNKILEVTLSSNGPSTPLLKLRIRIKGTGVSIMPVQMNDFKCTYRIRL